MLVSLEGPGAVIVRFSGAKPGWWVRKQCMVTNQEHDRVSRGQCGEKGQVVGGKQDTSKN